MNGVAWPRLARLSQWESGVPSAWVQTSRTPPHLEAMLMRNLKLFVRRTVLIASAAGLVTGCEATSAYEEAQVVGARNATVQLALTADTASAAHVLVTAQDEAGAQQTASQAATLTSQGQATVGMALQPGAYAVQVEAFADEAHQKLLGTVVTHVQVVAGTVTHAGVTLHLPKNADDHAQVAAGGQAEGQASAQSGSSGGTGQGGQSGTSAQAQGNAKGSASADASKDGAQAQAGGQATGSGQTSGSAPAPQSQPIVHSVSVQTAADGVAISVQASDPNQGGLQFYWSGMGVAGQGQAVKGEASVKISAAAIAKTPGQSQVRVVVQDAHGNAALVTITLQVGALGLGNATATTTISTANGTQASANAQVCWNAHAQCQASCTASASATSSQADCVATCGLSLAACP